MRIVNTARGLQGMPPGAGRSPGGGTTGGARGTERGWIIR